jgi:hypothetical protein
MQGVRRTHGREGAIGRRPSWTCKLGLQLASLDPAAISLGRERILAETLRQRGNRVVTNKQFDHWSYLRDHKMSPRKRQNLPSAV